jgi:glycosidase
MAKMMETISFDVKPFEWNADMNHEGMALWYKDSGPWWDSTYLRSNDGCLEEEEKDPNSLLNFYRQLLMARRSIQVFP